MDHKPSAPALYGVMAEFEDPTSLVDAARRTYDEGYRQFESYSPYPIHEVFDAMHIRDKRVSRIVLAGGLIGLCTGLALQVWVSAVAYPLNVAGRPYLSWPMFIPVTFELTILFSAFAAVFGMLGLNGLPMPYHPLFNAPNFSHASADRFFLCIETKDAKFDATGTRQFLEGLHPLGVTDVAE